MDDNLFSKLISLPFRFVFWLSGLVFKGIKTILEKAFDAMTSWLGKFIAVVVILFFLGFISQSLIK